MWWCYHKPFKRCAILNKSWSENVACVGRGAIVSFPNFGYWKNRLQILQGHMPVSRKPFRTIGTIPLTFICVCCEILKRCALKNQIEVKERVVMDGGSRIDFLPNLLGSLAFYRIGRAA